MALTALRPSQYLADLVATLGGTWHGYIAQCRCPAHSDHTPSLSLRQGDRGILVTCFAGCAPGDVLRALARLPVSGGPPPPPARSGFAKANVAQLWERALPVASDLGERYLKRRGFVTPPPDVRYLACCPHGPRPHTTFAPALLVAVRECRTLVALQRIFLDPATARCTAKAMLGRPGRGAWRAREAGSTLAIAEGFETAEAYAVLHEVPCWAALGARRLDLLEIPPQVRVLLIAEDNDAEGARAALKSCARYARSALSIRRHPPPPRFGDWADVLEARIERGGGSGG